MAESMTDNIIPPDVWAALQEWFASGKPLISEPMVITADDMAYADWQFRRMPLNEGADYARITE